MKEMAQNGSVASDDVIAAGRTVVLQKYKYLRTHLLNPNKNLQLGRDVVNLSGIVGQPYGTTFQMVSDHKNNKCFKMEVPEEVISLEDLFMNGDGGEPELQEVENLQLSSAQVRTIETSKMKWTLKNCPNKRSLTCERREWPVSRLWKS